MNRDNKQFHSVFAIRFIGYRVTTLRVCPTKATLHTLCETREVPSKPLRLLCSEATPATSFGLSPIDKDERGRALQSMADIRQFILDSKL